MAGSKGPVPGAFTASVAGTIVDFSQLVQPGYCKIKNLDKTDFVSVGIYDTDHAIFHPMLELLPGQSQVVRLSRYLQSEKGTGTGTGTAGAGNRLMVRANLAPCNVDVSCFEN